MTRLFCVFIFILFSLPAFAQTENPIVLIYDNSGQKTDKAFIDMARKGAERARNELGITYIEHTLKEGEERAKVFERYARSGKKLVIGLGFQNVSAVTGLADKYPNTHFSVIDGMIPPVFKNVQSVVFRDNEGGFLVGMIAALHSKTGMIGFIGGMDAPVIRNFAYGYKQGAEYVRSDIKIQRHMIGKTEEAFSNPEMAAKLAQEQINNGADIIFAAAGGSSLGAQQTAAHYPHVYAIGVDINQNDNFPGSMLTSLLKRVDKAVYNAMKQNNLNTWKSGVEYFGIREGAMDYAVDIHNRKLITKDTVDQVEKAKDFIIRGLVNVESYNQK
ncbi:MAG: BMP family ABC transporter substrate-binding protein [Rickettsiales bacterium]|nr:BMP family ABC transporter substrate-binding protein [Rickettsiales bacterium]